MKIIILGDVTGSLDEGMKNTTFNLSRELSRENQVLVVHPRQVFRASAIRKVRRLRPDIIHYVHGPSLHSLVATKWLAKWVGGAKSVVSATQPRLSSFDRRLVPFVKPDLVLVQSPRAQNFFEQLGCKTRMVPSGVDLERFTPISPARKKKLRQMYGLDTQAFIVLHIGSVQRSRNLGLVACLQREMAFQFVIVGSTTEKPDPQVVAELKSAGCIVWLQFFPQIEHLFQMADCYIFPVRDELGSIQFPLTVLEAAACNLPVVTTPFGGLPTFLPEGRGLYYAITKTEMARALVACKENPDDVETRSLAESFSWRNAAREVSECYRSLLNANRQ